MKNLNLLLAFLFCLSASLSYGQDRYLEPIFDVEVSGDLTYAVNATILLFPLLGEAIPQELKMDVYTPDASDTETSRPLVILCHTGNFLPHPDNGSTGGLRTDSAVVEIANRLASMGYVAASIDYRLGWNPIATTQEERVNTLINAAYRGVQDVRSCIRYFRKTAAEDGNPYGIDPSKVVVWGLGTGGYISLNAAVLDDYNKVLIPKFLTGTPPNIIPMVIEQVNGNINGTSYGIVPIGSGAPNEGDTLCYPNWVEYPSEFSMSVNMGGAMGDSTWLDPGDIPMITYQSPADLFAPYECAVLSVPPPINLPVVDVCGGAVVQYQQSDFGNNDDFAGMSWPGDFSAVANARNNGWDGLFPFPTALATDSAPWDWWNPATNPNHATGISLAPDMSPERGRAYVDTIMAYYAPRACVVLDLDCNLVGTDEVLAKEDVQLKVAPNPATSSVLFQSAAEFPIRDLLLYDLNGRLLQTNLQINNNAFELQRGDLPPGIYLARLRFDEGIASQKLIFR